MKKIIASLLLLFGSVTLIGCQGTMEDAGLGDDEPTQANEKVVNGVEAKNEQKMDTNYEDILGAYAIFEGKPFESNITYALILREEEYIDIVPEWMEYAIFHIETVEMADDDLTIHYVADMDRPEDSAGQLQLQVQEDEGLALVMSNETLTLYPVEREDLLEQGMELPSMYFE